MSNCLLNVVARNFRFYSDVAESIENLRYVVFIVLAGLHKIVGSWSLSGAYCWAYSSTFIKSYILGSIDQE